MSKGISIYGGLGIAEESLSNPVATAAANYIPILTTSFQTNEGFFLTNEIQGTSYRKVAQPGRRVVQGGITLEPDGVNFGYPLKWSNRSQTTSATYVPVPTSPSATPAAGGALTDTTTYHYKVCTIYQKTINSKYAYGPPSAGFSGTASGSNLTLDLAWTNPSASLPTGWAVAGTAIFRDVAGSGSLLFLDTVTGSGTTYTDAGAKTPVTGAVVPSVTPNSHSFTGGSTAAQKTFTLEVITDTGSSQQIHGCKVNTLGLTVPGTGVVSCSMNVHASDTAKIASTSASFSLARNFMGHNAVVYLEQRGTTATANALLEHFSVNLNNNLSPRYSLNGQRGLRRLSELRRMVNGTFTLAFEDFSMFDPILADTDYAIMVEIDGEPMDSTAPTATGGTSFTFSGSTCTYWPYQLKMNLPAISLTIAEANLNTDQQILQQVPFEAWMDPTAGYDIQYTLVNSTSGLYADVA